MSLIVEFPLLGPVDLAKVAVAVAGFFTLGFVFALWWYRKASRLILRTFAGQPSSRWKEVVRILVRATVVHVSRTQKAEITKDFFDLVRVRIEREILFPRPRPIDFESDEEFEEELSEWREDLRQSFGELVVDRRGSCSTSRASDPTVRGSLTAGDVNDAFAQITRYFDVLQRLKVKNTELRFLSTLRIDTGFIAPLHLLAGLLTRFDEDWRKILDAFTKAIDGASVDDQALMAGEEDAPPPWVGQFRLIQRFIFDCWLQWGPSIPHSSTKGDGDLTSLQYGFGDENNSIEIVGERRFLAKRLQALWEDQIPEPLARPARVQGTLVHTRRLPELNMAHRVGKWLKASWQLASENLHDGRIVLLLDSKENDEVQPGEEAYYYSAYLWVAFAVMVQSRSGRWRPLHHEAGSDETSKPWMDLLPFFEHCNIACPYATAMSKRLLALKALAGIHHIVQLAGGLDRCPIRFGYCCAIDDPGDGKLPWLRTLDLDAKPDEADMDRATILQWLQKMLKNESDLPANFAALFEGDDPIVRLDHYQHFSRDKRPHSTHHLISHVHSALDAVRAASAG